MRYEVCYNQNDELYHHGIKGQKWGVQNGPPYPLGASDHSSSEKKAGWRKSLHKTDKSTDSKKKSKHRLKLEEKYRSKGMSAEEAEKAAAKRIRKEKIALGATALVAAYAGYKLANSGELNRLAQKGKAFIHGNPPQWRKKPELADPNMSAEDILDRVVKQINPNHFNPLKPISEDNKLTFSSIGRGQNCRRCTLAYELRRRGFDVKATKTTNASGQDAVGLYNAMHKNTISRLEAVLRPDGAISEVLGTPMRINYAEDILKSMTNTIEKQNPNGSRGELALYFKKGGGHSVAWEIINGKAHLFDCQTGTIYDTQKVLKANIPYRFSGASFFKAG